MISEELLKQLEEGMRPKKIRVTIEFSPEFQQKPQIFEMDKFAMKLIAKPQQEWRDGKLIMSMSTKRQVKISGTLIDTDP